LILDFQQDPGFLRFLLVLLVLGFQVCRLVLQVLELL
jgi:hypothetical protein